MISLRGVGCADCGGSCKKGLGDCFLDEGNTIPCPTSATTGTTPGTNWASIFAPITSLLTARYAVPQLNAGQSITRTAAGYQYTQQPAGMAASGVSANLGSSLSLSGMLPLLLIGGAVLFVATRR